VARGSAVNLVGAAVSALCAFGLTVVVTRGMHRAEAGVFFSVTSLFLVATSVGQLGTDAGLVYFLSRARVLGRRELIGNYFRAALTPVLVTAATMTVAIFALSGPLGRLTNPAHASTAGGYLRTLAVFVVPACAATVLLSATRGLGTMRATVLVEQIGRQCLQVFLVACALLLPGTAVVAWAWCLPYLASLAVAFWWWQRLSRRHTAPEPAPPPGEAVAYAAQTTETTLPDVSVSRPFWKFTAPRSLASVAQLLMQRIDIVLVGALSGAVQAAIFTASTRFVVAGQMGRQAVSLAVQPPLAEAIAHQNRAAARQLFQTSAAWLLGVSWPLYLTFCLPDSPLLSIFGRGYGDGATILLLVSIGMLVGTACGDVDSVLIMAGRTSRSLSNMLTALAVMIGLDLWLIPGHGALGAAVGWGSSIAVKNLMALWQIWRAYGLHPFGRATVTMAVLSVCCFTLIPLALRAAPLGGWPALLVGLTLSGAAYLIGLWLLRARLELHEFRSLRRRRASSRT
jgi:O-antigen/teichoic acid export membrane protein